MRSHEMKQRNRHHCVGGHVLTLEQPAHNLVRIGSRAGFSIRALPSSALDPGTPDGRVLPPCDRQGKERFRNLSHLSLQTRTGFGATRCRVTVTVLR